jgi:hypothetical protein
MKLLISGGIAGRNAFLKEVVGKQREKIFATLDVVDFEKKTIENVLKQVPSSKYRTEESGKDIRFTAAHLEDDKLYVGSPTQGFVYSYPSFQKLLELNSPYLNDVHHVFPLNDKIYAVSTGLDAVVRFDLEGRFEEIISVTDKEVFEKFDPKTDYRLIPSTKPHSAHPNFLFQLKGDLYVTRFIQKDAVCVEDNGKTIDINLERPHDGHVTEFGICFTTVDGHVVIVDVNDTSKKQVYDLNAVDKRNKPLGWCRGVLVQKDVMYVAFSALRPTSIESNLRWVKNKLKGGGVPQAPLPSRIAKYTYPNLELIDEFEIPEGFTNVIFSVLKA